jgi:hypothetical protein
MAATDDGFATRSLSRTITQKGDPPGGYDTGWMRRPRRTRNPQPNIQLIAVAGTHAAHEIAVCVVLASQAAAAIVVVVITIAAGGDRAADDGHADETGSDDKTPAERAGFSLRGGRDRAGHGKRGEATAAIPVLIDMRNSIRLRRHRCGSACPLDGGFPKPARSVFQDLGCSSIG